MSVTDITPLETELAFRQSQQQKQVPAHKKASKPRLTRYKPYMGLDDKELSDMNWARKLLVQAGYNEEVLSSMTDEDCESEVTYLGE